MTQRFLDWTNGEDRFAIRGEVLYINDREVPWPADPDSRESAILAELIRLRRETDPEPIKPAGPADPPQHTPGPWYVWEPEGDASGWRGSARTIVICHDADPDDIPQEVAYVHCRSSFLSGPMVEVPSGLTTAHAPRDAVANAHLIAAAPDLWRWAKMAAEILEQARAISAGETDGCQLEGEFLEVLELFEGFRVGGCSVHGLDVPPGPVVDTGVEAVRDVEATRTEWSGFVIEPRREGVEGGFVVTREGAPMVNPMPGATWFRSEAQAKQGIAALKLAETIHGDREDAGGLTSAAIGQTFWMLMELCR